jgi:hypothetical protein
MDRIFHLVTCASIVLLTTALALAAPPINPENLTHPIPLLLRIIPS